MQRISALPRSVKRPLLGAIFAVFLATVALCETQPPSLTEVQQLQLRNLSLQYEIAQLRADALKAELIRQVNGLQRDGWTLDLTTLVYSPKEAAK